MMMLNVLNQAHFLFLECIRTAPSQLAGQAVHSSVFSCVVLNSHNYIVCIMHIYRRTRSLVGRSAHERGQLGLRCTNINPTWNCLKDQRGLTWSSGLKILQTTPNMEIKNGKSKMRIQNERCFYLAILGQLCPLCWEPDGPGTPLAVHRA